PRRALGANELPQLATRSARDGSFKPSDEGTGKANEVERNVIASPPAPEPEVVMQAMRNPTGWLEASGRRQGFVRLFAEVVFLSVASGTFRLAQTRIGTQPNLTPPATAMAITPLEPPSTTAA